MAINEKISNNVTDPGRYDKLIAEQKNRARRFADDAREWLELGRLKWTKYYLTNYLAKRSLSIRFAFPFSLALSVILAFIFVITRNIDGLIQEIWSHVVFPSALAFSAINCFWMWFLRYPANGSKCFKKAIRLDPGCGKAYMHLGVIALRRHQKRKACALLEQAVRLGINTGKIKKMLKSIYEKEFMAVFKERHEIEIKQQKIIENQKKQIRELCTKVATLEKLNQNLNQRMGQVKWEANRNEKLLNRKMVDQIALIQKRHQDRITALQQDKESRAEAKEMAERQFVRLSTEVMEAKAALEVRSLKESAESVEEIMGTQLWEALSDQAKTYMATAEQVHSVLSEQEEDPDYSLVGMELCKALETELNRMLVYPFVQSLNGTKKAFLEVNQTGESKGKPVYFTYLAKVVDHQNYPEVMSLTLGQCHFILKLALEKAYALIAYSEFLANTCSASGAIVDRKFLKQLETVTKTYRNTIAHCSPMNRRQYDHLRKLIFAQKDALLATCCKLSLAQPNSIFTNL